MGISGSSLTVLASNQLSCSVVVPTLNAAKDWPRFAPALLRNIAPQRVLIVDSESTDRTPQLAQEAGFSLVQIPRRSFNHGGTRQFGAQHCPNSDVIVFLTQDAVLEGSDALRLLVDGFANPQVGAVFGRQSPRPGACPIEAHARLFNYPAVSSVRSLESRREMGLKAAFFSNSFGAYRRTALDAVGGFPSHVIFGEDTITVARLLLQGWQVAYQAEATAYHSHRYRPIQDFKRYFDIGVLHSRESWLLQQFGSASGEGRRFVQSELAHLWPQHKTAVPSAVARTGLKLMGYQAGRLEQRLGRSIKRRLSMHRAFWADAEATTSAEIA